MTTITKRQLLGFGIGAAAALAGIGYAIGAGSGVPAYAHEFITVDEMKARDALIVDIRTPQEWVETGVIEGARLVTFNDPASFLAQVGPEIADGRELILVCRSGNRTRAAADAIHAALDNPITSVAGGMKQIIASGYQPVAVR